MTTERKFQKRVHFQRTSISTLIDTVIGYLQGIKDEGTTNDIFREIIEERNELLESIITDDEETIKHDLFPSSENRDLVKIVDLATPKDLVGLNEHLFEKIYCGILGLKTQPLLGVHDLGFNYSPTEYTDLVTTKEKLHYKILLFGILLDIEKSLHTLGITEDQGLSKLIKGVDSVSSFEDFSKFVEEIKHIPALQTESNWLQYGLREDLETYRFEATAYLRPIVGFHIHQGLSKSANYLKTILYNHPPEKGVRLAQIQLETSFPSSNDTTKSEGIVIYKNDSENTMDVAIKVIQ